MEELLYPIFEIIYIVVLLLIALAWFGLLFWIAISFTSLRRRNSDRRSLTDPTGKTWSTRIHWALPRARLGRVRKYLFRHVKPTDNVGHDKRWVDWFSNEIGLPILIVLSVLVLALFAVILAVELLLLLAITAFLGLYRLLFRQPWTIEVKEYPNGDSKLFKVAGLRKTLATHRRIRSEIPLGRHDPQHPF